MPQRASRLEIPVVTVERRHFWRCVPQQFVHTILEAGPSFTHERRYSIRGEFGALYFSASKELALEEVFSRAGADGEAIACVAFQVTAERVADLTQAATRTRMGVQLADLLRPRISGDAYAAPQSVARRVYGNKLHGLLAPSIHDPRGEKKNWFNLVLYPAQLLRSSIREISVEILASPGD
jgi:RES domain-containing protein